MDKKSFRLASGLLGFLASILFVLYVFQLSHTVLQGILYTSFALLAYALASYLALYNSQNRYVRLVPFVYLGAGLAMIYAVEIVIGGHRMFLYLALTTALIAAISYLYAAYSAGYGRASSKLGVKAH
ncbi:MAG: hypothetical protein QXN66_03600 [Thermoplasmatales archaeon]